MRWLTLSFYLLSSPACLLKEVSWFMTRWLERCNGILIVPMCLWILFWLNKQNRLSLIEHFITKWWSVQLCFSLMLRSFLCSLVKIFWGFIAISSLLERTNRNVTRVCSRRWSATALSGSPLLHTIMKKLVCIRLFLIILTMYVFLELWGVWSFMTWICPSLTVAIIF